jgi:hypothetical protein
VLLCVFLQLNLRLPFFRLPASISCNCIMHFTEGDICFDQLEGRRCVEW